MLPCVVSAVKSGATSLMRSAAAAGVMVAVLILFLLGNFGFQDWHSESAANEKPTRERRVGPEFFGYPHAGARLQEQQHGVEKARTAIEYAADVGASNRPPRAKAASRSREVAV